MATYVITLVAAPTFTPSTGTYGMGQSVALSTTTSGATIMYTTDGSTPTETHGTPCSNNCPITVGASETLKAMAFKSGSSDSGVATAQFTINVVFTIAPLPNQNPYNYGSQVVQEGSPMTYTVRPPPGYVGYVQYDYVVPTCASPYGLDGVYSSGTGNPDGSLSITVWEDMSDSQASFPNSQCAKQGIQTSNAVFIYLTITVLGENPYVGPQAFINMPLKLTPTSWISLSVSQISSTLSTVTYLANVTTQSYSGTVNLGLQSGSCAQLLGTPSVTVPSGQSSASATISLSTAGCAAGTNTPVIFTAGNSSVMADPQTLTLQTAPNAAVITNPPPGATIPGGSTIFSWNAVTGATQYCLYAGTTQQTACSGSVTSPASISLPTSGVVYATLGTLANGVWQYQQAVYTVNPSPSTAALVASGPTGVAVPNNMVKLRRTYYFSGGDPTTITSVSTGITGLTATLVGLTLGSATIEFQANGSVATGIHGRLTLHTPLRDMDWGDEYPYDGPQITVSSSDQTGYNPVGTTFTVTEESGLSGDLDIWSATTDQELSFGGSLNFQPTAAGTYYAVLWVNDDDLPIGEGGSMMSNQVEFYVNQAAETGTPPTIAGVSFTASPVAGTSDTLTITGSNFGASGFVQACPSDGSGGCTQLPQPPTWGGTIQIVWNVPTWAAGNTYCLIVTANESGGGTLSSGCVFAFYVQSSSPCTPVLTSVQVNGQQTNVVILGTSGTLTINATCPGSITSAQAGSSIQVTSAPLAISGNQVLVNYTSSTAGAPATGSVNLTAFWPGGSGQLALFATEVKLQSFSFTDSTPYFRDCIGTPQNLWPITQPTWPAPTQGVTCPQSGYAGDHAVYVSGATMHGTAVFGVSPSPPQSVPSLYIQGTTSSNGTFHASGATPSIAALASSFPVDVVVDTALAGSQTQFFVLNVNWSIAEGGTSCTGGTYGCYSAGTSANPVYVTLAQNLIPPLFNVTSGNLTTNVLLTYVELAVGEGGATSQAAAIAKTWNQFSAGTTGTPVVSTWNGNQLVYYPQAVGQSGCAINSTALLTTSSANGQCGAFVFLFLAALATNGIPVSGSPGSPASPVLQTFVCATDNSNLLIKNWNFVSTTYPGAKYPYAFVLHPPAGTGPPEMVPPPLGPGTLYFGDLYNISGLPGQNSSPGWIPASAPSEKLFSEHQIVMLPSSLAGAVPGGPYLDPSYGVAYASGAGLEQFVVAGYGILDPSHQGTNYQYVIRQPAGPANISLLTAPVAVAAPVPSAPADGAIGVSLTPTITWVPAPSGATTQTLSVSTDQLFDPSETQTYILPAAASSFTIPSSLAGGTRYYWFVSATNCMTNPLPAAVMYPAWSFTTAQ